MLLWQVSDLMDCKLDLLTFLQKVGSFAIKLVTNYCRYAISGDSRKVINEDTKSCRLSITLVQYTQNSPHSELAQIPLPSQLDEWKQYNQLLVQWEEKQKAAGTEVGAWPETPTTATLL